MVEAGCASGRAERHYWKHLVAAHRRFARLAFGSLPLLAVPALVTAQTVRGTVTDSSSGVPLSGVTVVMLDVDTAVVASALSDERGGFFLRAPSPGTYHLRLEAVGTHSETTPPLLLGLGEAVTTSVGFARRPRALPTVVVTTRQRCVSAPEAGRAVALLWDEVRKTLMVAELVAESEAYKFNLVQFEREVDPATRAVRRSRSWERVGMTNRPYESIPAESLAARGYVQTNADGTWYYAPDARTLLSDAFMRTHCLKTVDADATRPDLVGLAFEPIGDRRIPDVEGVLWLDRTTSGLRFLEYRYTGLPRSLRNHQFGGRVEFERLPTGAWVVQRWHISMPRLARQVRSMPSSLPEVGPPRLVSVTQDVVLGVIERGGEIRERVPMDAALSTRNFASVAGFVYDSTANGPLAEADIWLDAPGEALPAGRTVTDSAGTFAVDSIQPGRYVLTVTHSRLDALGTSLSPVNLDLERGEALSLSISTPSPEAIARSMCPAGLAPHAAIVRGAVRRESGGAVVAGAAVTARWGISVPQSELSAVADHSGHYTLCGLPRGEILELTASDARSRGEATSLTLGTERIAAVELLAPAGSGEIAGVVSDRTGRPVVDAEVRVVDLDLAVRTDSRGGYRIPAVRRGEHVLEARAVGFSPARRIIALTAAASDTINITMGPVPQTLATVRTTARTDAYRTGFYSRMTRNSGGHFLTSEQIRRSGYKRVTELLATVPGLQVRKRGNVSVMEFTGRGSRTFSSHGCPVAYAIDGVPFELASFGLDGEIGVEEIEAIEVYDAATAPAQYSRRGTGCGVILMWTRETAGGEQRKDAQPAEEEGSKEGAAPGKDNPKKKP